MLESLGSELYAHFTVASDQQIESAELRELAEDVGGGEVPMAGEEGRIVARLEPASQVQVGQEAELWVDASKVHLFDPRTGATLTTDARGAVRRGRWPGRGRAASPRRRLRSGKPLPASSQIAGGLGRALKVAGDEPRDSAEVQPRPDDTLLAATVDVLAGTLGLRDGSTGDHSDRVVRAGAADR